MMMEPNQIQNPAPYDGKQPPTFGPRVREPQETLQIRRRLPDDDASALWPTLTKDGSDYKLSMRLGHVDGRKHAGDAALPIEITDIPGQPDPIANALTVASGDKIYCKITENNVGVATAAAIEKAASWPTSTAPTLIGGDEATGANGTRNVRLCEIVTVDGLVKVKIWHTGNIAHFQPELAENTLSPASEGLGGRVLKLWNTLTGQWMFRMISKGLGQNTITEDGDEVVIRGTKKDANVAIWYGDGPRPSPEIEWADGYMSTGATVVGDEDPAVDPEEIDIKIPTVVAWDNVDAQIQVTDIGANGGVKYEVRGNGKDGRLLNSGSPIHEWVDGLVISEGDTELPTGGGLPEGSAGDILVHDGTEWVTLSAPEGSILHVLGCTGGVVGWVETENCED